jgi:hypothetical protein
LLDLSLAFTGIVTNRKGTTPKYPCVSASLLMR